MNEFKCTIKKIAKSSLYGNLGLFAGAGISKAILSDVYTYEAFSWKELLLIVAKNLNVNIEKYLLQYLSLPEIASMIVKEYSIMMSITEAESKYVLKNEIAFITNWHPSKNNESQYKDNLINLNLSWIITTNYDTLIESILSETGISYSPKDILLKPTGLIPIYHLHGSRFDPETIVITQDDYVELFRPSDYRQAKLALTLKESTTIFVGYGLGDINVLTAIDWVNNVYNHDYKNQFAHDVIQLLYTNETPIEPYRDEKGTLIVEINDILEFLKLLNEEVDHQKMEKEKIDDLYRSIIDGFDKYSESYIDELISDVDARCQMFDKFFWEERSLSNGMLGLFDKVFSKLRELQLMPSAFEYYKFELDIILEIGRAHV